jgi:iron complex outermembrane recepter protein
MQMPSFGSRRASFFRAIVSIAAWMMLCGIANAQTFAFDIPPQSLSQALRAYARASNEQIIFNDDLVHGRQAPGLHGSYTAADALERLLKGTDLSAEHITANEVVIGKAQKSSSLEQMQIAAAPVQAASGAALETVTVTSSKIGGDIQNIPISITALSQEQLTATQTAGGPDLVKQVPNMSFTKTNFSGYSIQLRGIGTQAISVTTDPAVAVAFNDIPFIRNHFFEQEFYDVSQVEVLRGPQGTLYGRNATAGVVNLVSAKPTDQFEAMASADFGNYQNRRFEGMINLPIVDDRVDIRAAGEWTKRNGYSTNDITNTPIDGRDLWSSRVTIGWKPSEKVQTYLVWEHFSENDDRIRSAKQLCTPIPVPTEFGGLPIHSGRLGPGGRFLSQGCGLGSLYASSAFGEPDGSTLPFWVGLAGVFHTLQNINNGPACGFANSGCNPYTGVQSSNLRVISSELNPTYGAKNDTIEFNADYSVTPSLTFTSQTGYNTDFLRSTEDYDRFVTVPGVYNLSCGPGTSPATCEAPGVDAGNNTFCDPQLGCSNRLVAEDLSDEHAWQFSQEFRLTSNFAGPLNFSAGGNYLHYETEENYYVFINALTLLALNNQLNIYNLAHVTQLSYQPGITTDSFCLTQADQYPHNNVPLECSYIDPNPITRVDNQGHNYFLSQNPYTLNSYAGFGEAYYNVTQDLKLTGGLRWTEDRKHFVDIPSQVLLPGYGYPVSGVVDQQWDELTGRFAANWTPKLDFTDQTLVYASYAHGYKAGGANPPGAQLLTYNPTDVADPIHPLTFKPEFIDAFELGTKNTLLDGALVLNGDVFYYNYTGYQISEIVDRTAINLNFNATVKGAELETTWEPAPGLKFSFAGGYEDTRLANGSQAVDLMDRTAGNPDWVVVRPFVTQASNCILPAYVVAWLAGGVGFLDGACTGAYAAHIDPVCGAPYVSTSCAISPPLGYVGPPYPGFDPLSVDPTAPANVNNGLGLPPNNGAGIDKDLSGNKLPNAPPFTVSFGAQYTVPITADWAGTLRGDYYWQDYSWARVFNDNPYDRLRGYTNINLTLILTNQNGWQVMGYLKNVFNTTAITGDFLNSDDTDLTTNVFLTDPRLFGIRVTKNW